MRVKFLEDYIGRETAMQFVKADDILDIPIAQALELIRLKVAKEIAAETIEADE